MLYKIQNNESFLSKLHQFDLLVFETSDKPGDFIFVNP